MQLNQYPIHAYYRYLSLKIDNPTILSSIFKTIENPRQRKSKVISKFQTHAWIKIIQKSLEDTILNVIWIFSLLQKNLCQLYKIWTFLSQ